MGDVAPTYLVVVVNSIGASDYVVILSKEMGTKGAPCLEYKLLYVITTAPVRLYANHSLISIEDQFCGIFIIYPNT